MSKKGVFTKQLAPVTDIEKLKKFRETVSSIHGLDGAIRTMGSSNKKMARAMGEYRDGDRFYSPSTISHWRHPRARWSIKMQDEHIEQAARVINDWAQRQLARADVRFQMRANSPWHCWIETLRACGHWEKLDLRRTYATQCRACKSTRLKPARMP